jgi:hypothetical protein
MPGEVTSSMQSAGLPSSSMTALFQAISKNTAAAIQAVPGMTPAIEVALRAAQKRVYSASFSTVYLSSLAFGGLALVSIFFSTDNFDEYFTNFINKTVTTNTIAKVKSNRGDLEKV